PRQEHAAERRTRRGARGDHRIAEGQCTAARLGRRVLPHPDDDPSGHRLKGTTMKPSAHPLTAAALAALLLALPPGGALADGAPKVLKKVPPEFPGEAVRKGVTDGVLKAKLSIDGDGAVTGVEIVEASPPKAKIFNTAATEALNKWRFEATGKPQSFE